MSTAPRPPQPAPTQRFGIRIAGTGVALPPRVVTNDDLAKTVETSDEWIYPRTGIKQRRLVDPGVGVRQLTCESLRQALANAKLEPSQLDFLTVATLTPEMCCPSTAARVVSELKATPAGAMDISAACSGFVYGINLAASMIQSGAYRNIAVVGAEVLSNIVDWKDRRTCILFGDGAGAAVLMRTDDPSRGCLHQTMASNGDLWNELYCPRNPGDIPPGDTIFSGAYNTLQMNGQAIFKFAVKTLLDMTDRVLAEAGISPEQLAMVIPHQSNLRIMEMAREKLKLPKERFYTNIDRFGNTSAASVPICLHELIEAKRLKEGDIVLFLALGGGLTWASSLWRL